MSTEIANRIFRDLERVPIICPHSHIEAPTPVAKTLADILGYHYYTELLSSAGLSAELIEAARAAGPKQLYDLMVPHLRKIRNTIQYSWLQVILGEFFGFNEHITPANADALWERSKEQMAASTWSQQVIAKTNLAGIFLTNAFDDPLTGFDTKFFIPCLRTDDLVFHYRKPEVRERLLKATGIQVTNAATMQEALGKLFTHFVKNGARACAISLPTTFSPEPVTDEHLSAALQRMIAGNEGSADGLIVSRGVFWKLAQLCEQHGLPFDLMIGVTRDVFPAGVHQGRDLYDARVSLLQYRELFNKFPKVKFPVSVLPSGTVNQELVSYSWIFPNVYPNGHWWYSNIPAYIDVDAAARMQAVPEDKIMFYYSDAYFLEFVLPKFRMARWSLAKILAAHFVGDCHWSVEEAVELGVKVLRGNVHTIFNVPV